jgi:hypothetical protein
MELNIRYSYQRLAAEVVVCHLSVQVIPTLTSLVNTDFLEIAGHGTNRTALRTRTMYGARVSIKVSGEFSTFDMILCLNFLVDCIVLLQLPFYLVQFIALNCLGFISEIYRSAKKAHFNVQQQVFGQVARLMLAGSGFEAMAAADGDGSHLSEHDILTRLQECFHAEIEGGILTEHETVSMAKATFHALNVNGNDYIELSEFLRAFTVDNCISVQHAAKFFDQDAKLSRLQRLVDNSVSDRETIFSRQSTKEECVDAEVIGKGAKCEQDAAELKRVSGEAIIMEAASRETTMTSSPKQPETAFGVAPDLERRVSALEAQICRFEAQNTLQAATAAPLLKTSPISTSYHKRAQALAGFLKSPRFPSRGSDDPRVPALEQRADQIEDILLAMDIAMANLKDNHKRIPDLLKKAQHLDDGLGLLQSRLDKHVLEEEAAKASIKRDIELAGQRVEKWMRVLMKRVEGSTVSNNMLRQLEQSTGTTNGILLDTASKKVEAERPLVLSPDGAGLHATKPLEPSRNPRWSRSQVWMWEPFAEGRGPRTSASKNSSPSWGTGQVPEQPGGTGQVDTI